MKHSFFAVFIGVLATCAMHAALETGPLINALRSDKESSSTPIEHRRQKRTGGIVGGILSSVGDLIRGIGGSISGEPAQNVYIIPEFVTAPAPVYGTAPGYVPVYGTGPGYAPVYGTGPGYAPVYGTGPGYAPVYYNGPGYVPGYGSSPGYAPVYGNNNYPGYAPGNNPGYGQNYGAGLSISNGARSTN